MIDQTPGSQEPKEILLPLVVCVRFVFGHSDENLIKVTLYPRKNLQVYNDIKKKK